MNFNLNFIHVDEALPSNNEWVLAHCTNTNWRADKETHKHYWKVLCFERGLSKADRELMPDSNPRKHSIHGEDEFGNNLKPYIWSEFGPGSQFGQDVDYWASLPAGWVGFKQWGEL